MHVVIIKNAYKMTDKDYKLMQRRGILQNGCAQIFSWLQAKGHAFKDAGIFPVSLTDYYTEKDDIEVAAIAEMIVPDALALTSFRRHTYIRELRNILGNHPSDMIAQRGFMNLVPRKGLEGLLDYNTGVQKSDLFNILDWIWEVRTKTNVSLEHAMYILTGMEKDILQEVPDLSARLSGRLNVGAAQMVILRMSSIGGLGKGMWKQYHNPLPCPFNKDVMSTLRIFYPLEAINSRNVDEILSFIGYDCPSDYIYAHLTIEGNRNQYDLLKKEIRSLVQGKVSQVVWQKSYKYGLLFLPENHAALLQERERKCIAMAKLRKRRRESKNSCGQGY